MILQRVIQYSDLYPEEAENLPDVRAFLGGLRRKDLCTITANMVQRIVGKPFFDNNLDPREEEYDGVRFFLSSRDPAFVQDVINRYTVARRRAQSSGFQGSFIATSKAAAMSFQRLFFSVIPEKSKDFSVQIEEDYFKGLLLVNESVYKIGYDESTHSTEPSDLRLAHLYLAYNYANEDVETGDLSDLFRRQLTKSLTLFTFLFRSKDKRVKILRRRFMAHYHIGSWSEFIIPHIMTLHYLNQESGLLVILGRDKTGRAARRVIREICIDKEAIIPIKDNSDYLVFRGKPYIRMKKHHYAITNQAFVIEHLFNSVYFELKAFRKDARFMSDDEFRQFYTTEFSQKYMFEGYVNQCLPTSVLTSKSGSECDALLDEARTRGINVDGIVPPDFFIKTPDGCVVIEYKDALTSAKVKESRNPERLFAEIREKFFENGRGRHKGISQLLDSAKAIQDGSFFFDDCPTDSVIYPVLVVDNLAYTMRGMHTILEYLMRDECQRRGMRSDTIRPLILMDVATLKLYSDYLSQNGLIRVFEDYYQHIDGSSASVPTDPFETLISFSEYMKDKEIKNMGKIYDKLIREARPVLRSYN